MAMDYDESYSGTKVHLILQGEPDKSVTGNTCNVNKISEPGTFSCPPSYRFVVAAPLLQFVVLSHVGL